MVCDVGRAVGCKPLARAQRHETEGHVGVDTEGRRLGSGTVVVSVPPDGCLFPQSATIHVHDGTGLDLFSKLAPVVGVVRGALLSL